MSNLTTGLESTLRDFETSLLRIRQLAEKIFEQTTVDPEDIAINGTQQSGCTVLLTGFFEEFLKSAVREYLVAIPRTGMDFVSLPPKMKRIHFEGGHRVLAEVQSRENRNKPQFFNGITVSDVLNRLYSPTTRESNDYQIVWEAFADTKQSPSSDTVSDLLKGLEFTEVWPVLHGLAGRTALDAKLRELVEKRNECAHTGRNTNVPSPPDILDYVEMLQAIATAITTLLCNGIASQPCSPDPYVWR